MGKPFMSSQLELARNRQRDSLDIFGQTSFLQQNHRAPGSHTNVPLFSKVPGSAWDEALKAAERLLEGKDISPGRPSNASRTELTRLGKASANEKLPTTVEQAPEESSLDDLISQLEAAEKDPKVAAKEWAGMLQESQRQFQQMENHAGYQRGQSSDGYERRSEQSHEQRPASSDGYDSRRSRKFSSESGTTTRSAVSEDFMNERANQWGYGVVLKTSSRESTPRTSGGSSTGVNGGQVGTQAIPSVSRDVKDALHSFMLAFLVCDATAGDFPILYCSAGFTTMTGYSTDEIVGKNCRFLQGPDTDRSEVAKIREALKNGNIFTGTLLNYKKDGTPFWNLLTLSPIKDDDGKVIKYIGMQAEQHSEEAQPRNSKGQKSPAVRAMQGPSRVTKAEVEKQKQPTSDTDVSSAQRRHSAGSIPRPPMPPQKALPAGAGAGAASSSSSSSSDRRSGGPELHSGEDRRASHRYSLTSNPARMSRNSYVHEDLYQPHRSSAVEDFHQPIRAASKLREIVLDNGKVSSSSYEVGGMSSKANSLSSASSELSKNSPRSDKSKTSRLTSRILRLFRKDSKESKRRSEGVVNGKEIMELSGSDDEGDDFTDTSASARSSVSRRHSAAVFATNRDLSQTRLDTSADDLADRIGRMTLSGGGGQQNFSANTSFEGRGKQGFPANTSFEGSGKQGFSANTSFEGSGKQQFCIVEGSSPSPAFDRTKQQFCFIESSSPRSFDTKKQFCVVEPATPAPDFDRSKEQFCIVEPSSSPPPYDQSRKRQFCIVHT